MVRRIWEEVPADAADVAHAAAQLGVPPVIARLLCQRGLADCDQARAFLDPCVAQLHDPFLLRDMREATTRIMRAIARQEAIAIHGDYDVDGVTSTAILRRAIASSSSRVASS